MALNLKKDGQEKIKFDLSKKPLETSAGNNTPPPKKSNNLLWIILGVLAVALGIWYMTSNSGKEEVPPIVDNNPVNTMPKVDSTTAATPVSADTTSNTVTNDLPANSQPAVTSVNAPAVAENAEVTNQPRVTTTTPVTYTTPPNNQASQISIIAKPKDKTHANFAAGSASINKINSDLVKEISDFLSKNPNSKVTINGYASSEGDLTTNQDLSQKRAENVRDYLTKKGISPSQLQAVGKGVENPIGDNNTNEGRMQNRRTEIVF
jgi:outer membrane protein OmpA-like peptidoglycan-associated protein